MSFRIHLPGLYSAGLAEPAGFAAVELQGIPWKLVFERVMEDFPAGVNARHAITAIKDKRFMVCNAFVNQKAIKTLGNLINGTYSFTGFRIPLIVGQQYFYSIYLFK